MQSENDLYVKTQYDGKDYNCVIQVFYYSESGEEVIHELATKHCFGIDTCADHGYWGLETLELMVKQNLKFYGVCFNSILMLEPE